MKLPTLALAASLLAGGAFAQTPGSTLQAPSSVDHYVYLSFLPEASELQADAKKNGLEILRLDKTAETVVVTYRYPNGTTATLGYKKLDAASAADRVIAREQATEYSQPTRTVERVETVYSQPSTDVVYVERPSTTYVYRDTWNDFWAPLTIGLGVGYVSGHYSHHHHYRSYPRYSYHNRWNHGGGHWRGGHHGGWRGGHRRH